MKRSRIFAEDARAGAFSSPSRCRRSSWPLARRSSGSRTEETTMNDGRRITLLARSHGTPDRDWQRINNEETRLVTIESMTVLRYTLQHAVSDIDLDIE